MFIYLAEITANAIFFHFLIFFFYIRLYKSEMAIQAQFSYNLVTPV